MCTSVSRHPLLRRCGLLPLFAASLFFQASPVFSARVVIGVIGDYGSAVKGPAYASNVLLVANLIKSWNPDFIMTTGDNNYNRGEAITMDTNVGQFFHEFIYPYMGSFGEGATSNRFFPTIGNHDWGFDVADLAHIAPYTNYFSLPGNERYYNYRHGPVEIFALASDQVEPDGATPTSIQALWLSNSLAASTAPWRLVYCHASPYSSGSLHGTYTGQIINMLWPFKAWGATALVAGHDHIYERILTNGLHVMINGMGGDRLDSVHFPLVAGSVTNYLANYGAQRIVATETNITFDFINITQTFLDTFTIEAMPARLALHLTNGVAYIQLTGSPGQNYITEGSTNFLNWTALSTNNPVGGTVTISDPNSASIPWRFYRARLGH